MRRESLTTLLPALGLAAISSASPTAKRSQGYISTKTITVARQTAVVPVMYYTSVLNDTEATLVTEQTDFTSSLESSVIIKSDPVHVVLTAPSEISSSGMHATITPHPEGEAEYSRTVALHPTGPGNRKGAALSRWSRTAGKKTGYWRPSKSAASTQATPVTEQIDFTSSLESSKIIEPDTADSTQESRTQESSTQESSTQESSTQESSTQESSTQESSTQESSTQETIAEVTIVEETSTEAHSTQESGIQENGTLESTSEASTTATSTTDTSTTETSTTETSITETSITETSTTEASTMEATTTKPTSVFVTKISTTVLTKSATSATTFNVTSLSTTSGIRSLTLVPTSISSSMGNISTTELSTSLLTSIETHELPTMITGFPTTSAPGQIFPFTRTRPKLGTIYLKPYDSRPSISWSFPTTTSATSESPSPTPSWKVVDVKVNVHDEAVQDQKMKGPIDDFDPKDWDWVTVNLQTDEIVEVATSTSPSFVTTTTTTTTVFAEQSETQIFIHMGEDGKLTQVTNTKDFPLTFPSDTSDTLATPAGEVTNTSHVAKRAAQSQKAGEEREKGGKEKDGKKEDGKKEDGKKEDGKKEGEKEKTGPNWTNFGHWTSTKYSDLTKRPHSYPTNTIITWTMTVDPSTIATSTTSFNGSISSSFHVITPTTTATRTIVLGPEDARRSQVMANEDAAMSSIMNIEWHAERMKAYGYKRQARSERIERVDPACYDPNASKKGVICPRPDIDERVDPACFDPDADKKGVICPRPKAERVDPACYDPNASKKGVICPRPDLDERVDPACFDPDADKKGVICPRPEQQ